MKEDEALAALLAQAPQMAFFELVERLERLLQPKASTGGNGPPVDEAIRFRHDVRPIFHSGDVASAQVLHELARGRRIVEVTTTFLGLVGARSLLPGYATEDVLAAESQDQKSLRAFYDLFHHRLIGLSYGAMVSASAGASRKVRGDDDFTRRMTSLGGLAPRLDEDALGVPRRALPSLGPLLLRRPRGRHALEARLALAMPELPFRIEELSGRNVVLPGALVSRLGEETMRLGETALLGEELEQQPGLLLVATGPVSRAVFEALQPGGALFPKLRAAVLSVTGGALEAELRVSFLPEEEPAYALGDARLGDETILGGEWEEHRVWLTARIPLVLGDEHRSADICVERG
jgi:type VI secretion system protein ImpH